MVGSNSIGSFVSRQPRVLAVGDSILSKESNVCQVLTSPLFRNLEDDAIRHILQASKHRSFLAGEFLCRQGEEATDLLVLATGQVKATGSTESGGQALFKWLSPGDVIGVGAILSPPVPYIWSTQATADTQTLCWAHGAVSGFGARWPSFYQNGLWIALRWAQELQARFQELSVGTAEQRIAYVTLQLANHTMGGANGTFELRVSDEEMAQMAGTNMFTVNKILNRWRRLGYIEKGRRRLSIRGAENIARLWLRPTSTVRETNGPR